MSSHAIEIAQGERFAFGENWARYLGILDEARIGEAQESLKQMLEIEDLEGKSFLDIGSGSGLFSLAARRLGARVHSLDYDPRSVACTEELRRRYAPSDAAWTVEEGSALDRDHLRSLGRFDVVYSWGVLHHTGKMWDALDAALLPVAPGGRLFIAIYNDTGKETIRWRRIKRIYNALPARLKTLFILMLIAPAQLKEASGALVRFRLGTYLESWTRYESKRGMSRWHDIVDWIGGYPYECATVEEISDFYRARGCTMTRLKCDSYRLGPNEFVFAKDQ
jgi:2-polyprenyl-6-hydroxyphenyl methylase/3-demethylubiquinone-9 3-methyltransferase